MGKENIEDWVNKELLLVASKRGDVILGNGVSDESFEVFEGEWYRLRVVTLFTGKDKRFDLDLDSSCDAHPVAYDGVWCRNVPGDRATTYSLTVASRIDLAIRCSTTGTFNIKYAGSAVATLVVSSGNSSTPNATPFTSTGGTWQPLRPNYPRDLLNEDESNFE